ncbi:DUF1064 domain-containing protein [Domibacillus aminovorans]|uniref:Uncharacterized protein n=1 Tax=Domibacillus aminovorans TaxID=29332 RepID=A0A177L468_9BACI|nr:DUF1064 domain-containing protein [Domibacillus aminovorans]OAH60478.1 hypothetical protein AWH49_16590 [Domibacillus aminovorans]
MRTCNWNAKKTFVYGILFDSKAEVNYYLLLLADPDVEKVEVQPVFEIIPTYAVTCYGCNGSGKRTSPRTGRPIIVLVVLEKVRKQRQGRNTQLILKCIGKMVALKFMT